jgi:hypothetical protein
MSDYVTVKILLNSKEIFLINPNINIKKKIGDHTELILQGVVREESHQQLISVNTMTDLQIQYGEELKNLFYGIVTHIDIQVRTSGGEKYQELYCEAKSYSCLMDRVKKCASFQKTTATYKEIVKYIVKDYEESNYILSPQATDKTVKRYIVQYNETDWEFIKRMASSLKLPLVASHITKGAKFTFGSIWKDDVFRIRHEDEWQVEIIHSTIEKSDKTAGNYEGQQQYFKWNVERPEVPPLEIGDGIHFRGIQYYVKETNIEIKDYTLKQESLLFGKKGFHVVEEINPFITGLSLRGSVKEVKNNQLKVKLDIDALKENDCWFPYATFYSTFYCMPEKGDRINLYFPDNVEGHAFVLNSVMTNPEEAVIESSSQSKADSSGKGGKKAGKGTKQEKAEEKKVIDISPILQMLASPENGTLINASAVYKDSKVNAPSSNTSKVGGNSGNSVNMQSVSSGGTKGNQQNYDFQTLAANENIKVLCTKGGKMVVLDDATGSVSIVCNDGTFIGLEGNEITIVSDQKITFHATEDINLKAGKVLTLSAEERIQINCEECGIEIKPEKVGIQGTDIKINE